MKRDFRRDKRIHFDKIKRRHNEIVKRRKSRRPSSVYKATAAYDGSVTR